MKLPDVIRKSMAVVVFAALSATGFAVAGAARASAASATVFDNWNISGVTQSSPFPPLPTLFTLTQEETINTISDYHWFNGSGTRGGGKISIVNALTGHRVATARAVGSKGQGGVRNVNWTATFNVDVGPGTWQVLDRSPSTWSWNSQSNDEGFADVTATPVDPVRIFNNTNIFGVTQSSAVPPAPTLFTLFKTTTILSISTYHWNNAAGTTAAGSIYILKPSTGQVMGYSLAAGSSGQGGVPNANWTATFNVTLPAGTWQVMDSSPSTWSWNAQSGDEGFSQVAGTR
jgi:hypothetical protein